MTHRPKIVLRGAWETGFWFHIAARNGQILATSEMYRRKAGAVKGIMAMVSACVWIDAKAEQFYEDSTQSQPGGGR